MTYAGFRLTGRFAALVRPSDRTPAVEGDTWAQDKVGGVGGTEVDATFLNRLKANLEAFVEGLGGNLNDGDVQLINAINVALALKAESGHDHDDRYVRPADVVNDLTSIATDKPLSAAQGKVLADLIDGLGDVIVVDDITAAEALTGLDNGDLIHVIDAGAGQWARFQVTSAGDGTWDDSEKVLIWTQDQAPSSHGHNVADLLNASANAKSLLQASDYAAMKVLLAISTEDVSGLSAALGAKVSTSAIIDDLTSDEADKPLSAAQGKALKDGLDAIIAGQALPPGHLHGLTLSNNTSDAVNDIDIAAGSCRSDDDTGNILLPAGLTKRLDAAWDAGHDAGGLDAGSKAALTWYHVFAIARPDTGAADVLFSTSLSPALPSHYTLKRRIGSIITSANSSILRFLQVGDLFWLATPIVNAAATSVGTSSVNFTLTTPLGVRVAPILNLFANKAAALPLLFARSPELDDISPNGASSGAMTHATIGGAGVLTTPYQHSLVTNLSAQIAVRSSESSTNVHVATFGWRDFLGRF